MTLHITRGTNRQFAAVVRAPGARKYTLIGKWTKSKRIATMCLATAMMDTRWKRGAVLFMTDYYEPTAILRMER